MINKLQFFKAAFAISVLVFMASCQCSYQYNVLVNNNTGEPIKVKYKTLNAVSGTMEKEIVIPAEAWRFEVIRSKDISYNDGECVGLQAAHAAEVAEYFDATIRDTIPSKIAWNSDQIKFEKADIQQGEFTITYELKDFGL